MTARQYRIRLDGVLGTRFETAFDGFHLEQEPTGTVLVGTCADSSALFGVLGRIEALGLGLLTVDSRPVDDGRPRVRGRRSAQQTGRRQSGDAGA